MGAQFYLSKLVIQNFATFKNQTIHFRPGLNSIVGETGSGKSLVLDALEIILGARGDKKVVRRETDYSVIEASFFCKDESIKDYLNTEGFPLDGEELVVKRMIYKNGSTKAFMNHLSCSIGFLSQFSRRYIDLVGQFENQKLLSENYQLQLLDNFAKLDGEVFEYKKIFQYFNQLNQRRIFLEQDQDVREQRLDYLNFQIQEIEKINPSVAEEDDLIMKKNLLLNFEKNQKLHLHLKDLFEGTEGRVGLLSQVKSLHLLLKKNSETFFEQINTISNLEDSFYELSNQIEKKLDFELNPDELEGVIEKLDHYQKLKKKFGGSVESILQSLEQFSIEREALLSADVNLDELKLEQKMIFEKLQDSAKSLHTKRLLAAQKLSQELTQKIQLLKMNGATVNFQIEEMDKLTETGTSRAVFLAETNPGEGFFKVKEIASGGELSRILLSIRQLLSKYDSIGIFLFDEIDTGLGGETATCIGKALKEVSSEGQVIAITHLPQIAQFAETLIMVQKETQFKDKFSRTESSVKEIVGKQVLKEVRAMASLH